MMDIYTHTKKLPNGEELRQIGMDPVEVSRLPSEGLL